MSLLERGNENVLRKWDDLPDFMKITEVRPYWEVLNKRRGHLLLKRLFDIIVALILLVVLAVPMFVIVILIKTDSNGPVFYRQNRVTTYGKQFKIHKFRTMIDKADQTGTAVTIENDSRITKIGKKLRDKRLDELPQLIDVLQGNMSFVGTRPEAVKYFEQYQPEYYATLLMPAGITSECSIHFKDEAEMLKDAKDIDSFYIDRILPQKMKWNLESVKNFNFLDDFKTLLHTVIAVLK